MRPHSRPALSGDSSTATTSPIKKTAHASEQERPDVAARRQAWFDAQPDLDPETLVFIDETAVSTKMVKAELRQMIAQGSGANANCSSIGGMRGSKGRSASSASKFGVIGLTRAAALDYANKGIRINAVCPGIIGNTPMAERVTKDYDPDIMKAFVAAEPIGRLGEPDEIAAAVLWLCSPAASFVLGHALAVDGGILA